MPLPPRMLVAVDASQCARFVVEHAALEAAGQGHHLVILHVIEPPDGVPADAVIELGGRPTTAQAALVAAARQHLATLEDLARELGADVHGIVRCGPPARVISHIANQHPTARLFVGTHRRSWLSKAAFGSVSDAVLRLADVPVHVVPPRRTAACTTSCAWCAPAGSLADQALAVEAAG